MYTWMKSEAESERMNGYPMLSLVTNFYIKPKLDLLNEMALDEQSRMLHILTALADEEGANLAGDILTQEEVNAGKAFNAKAKLMSDKVVTGYLPATSAQHKWSPLRKNCKKLLAEVTGQPVSPNLFTSVPAGDWRFNVGFKMPKSYYFDVRLLAGFRRLDQFGTTSISDLSNRSFDYVWSMVCSPTMWIVDETTDIDQVAASVRIVVQHIYDALPELLDGLNIND
jgi:hypothetical protein